jgi:hypothetical protein
MPSFGNGFTPIVVFEQSLNSSGDGLRISGWNSENSISQYLDGRRVARYDRAPNG